MAAMRKEAQSIALHDIDGTSIRKFISSGRAVLINENGIDSSFWKLDDWGINRYHSWQKFELDRIKYYQYVMNQAAVRQKSFTEARSAGFVLKLEPIQEVFQDAQGIIYALKKYVSGERYYSGQDERFDQLLFQYSNFMNTNIGCRGIDVTADNVKKQTVFLGALAGKTYTITDLCMSIKALAPVNLEQFKGI